MKHLLRRLHLSTNSSNNDDPLSDRSSRTSRHSESNNNAITTTNNNKSLSSLSGLFTAAKHSITRAGSFKHNKDTQDLASTTSSDMSKLISEEPSSSSSMPQSQDISSDMPRDSPLETAELDTFQLAIAPEIIQTDAFQLAQDQSLFLQDEDLQIRAAMELSVREDPEAAEIEAAKELSQLILQPDSSPSNSTAGELSYRYWKYNALNYEDKVADGFYDISGALTEQYSNMLPPLLDLQEIPVSDQINFEVILVDRTTDTHLVRLEQRIIELSSRSKVADGLNRRGLIYKIASVVCDQMGGRRFDPEKLLSRWRTTSKELRISLGNVVLPLGRLQIGLGRHRALLFKVLADAAGIPCQLLKGKNYTGIDEGALNVVKVDSESEIVVDWTGTGVGASDLISIGQYEYLCQERYNPTTRQTSTIEKNIFNEMILKGLDASDSTVNDVERKQSEPKEVGVINAATDSMASQGSSHLRSPSWTEGVGSLDSDQKKVKDVSQYMLDAAKGNPTFARKLQEVFIESGVEAPPDLFAEISPVQLQEQITEDLKLLDESRRSKTGKPKSATMGFGSNPATASSYSSSSEDRLQRLSSVEGLGERRPLYSSSSNLSPSSTPNSSGSSGAAVQSNSPVIPASAAISLVQETLTPELIKRVPVAAAAAATAAVVASSMVVAAAKADLGADPNLDVPVAAAATATAAVVVATSAVVGRKIPLPDLTKDYDSERGASGNNVDKADEDYKDSEINNQNPGFAGERGSDRSVSSSSGTPEQVLEDVAECEIPWEELEIGDRIGLGSYGEVYRAEWHGTEVAVKKFIEQDISGDALEEFASEVRLMKRLRHPNVVLFMGAVMRPPNLSIVTEFLPRGSLYRLIHRSNSVIDERRRMRMALDIARGMNYLHNSTPVIVHRDLKSPNLLVDKNWVVKVCDFGLSRLKHNTYLSSKSTAGTPEWMAPEVLRNEPSNEKADVYSFGVILWELVTMQQPWAGLIPMQVVGAVGYQFRTLDVPDDVDPDLAEIITQCWRREPAARPSFGDLLVALKPLQKLPCRQTTAS